MVAQVSIWVKLLFQIQSNCMQLTL